jgi:hypothetical protein
MGLLAGVLLTMSVGEWLREQAEESSTVAHAVLEAGPAPAQPERAPEPPVARAAQAPEPEYPQPSAAEPAATQEQAAAPQVAVAAANAPAAPALKPTAAAPAPAPVPKLPATPDQAAAAAPRPALPASAQPAPAQTPPVKPNAPAVVQVVQVVQDPNSEDAKLAAAAQVRVKGDTKIDDMLDQALTAEKRAPAAVAAAPAPATLALTPSRDEVVNAMSVIVPAIRGCAQGQSGLAPMSIVVLNDGRVETAALSSGPFQGTASGRCMEGVVRRARFPRFKQANFRVQFPFAVQ